MKGGLELLSSGIFERERGGLKGVIGENFGERGIVFGNL